MLDILCKYKNPVRFERIFFKVCRGLGRHTLILFVKTHISMEFYLGGGMVWRLGLIRSDKISLDTSIPYWNDSKRKRPVLHFLCWARQKSF